MTPPTGPHDGGALDAVQQLESALTARNAARDAAEAELAAASTEAERLLGSARAAGTAAGHRRVAALRAESEAEARAIRAGGDTEAEMLRAWTTGARDELVAELTALLFEEV